MSQIGHVGWNENKLGGISAAQSSVFLVRRGREASGGEGWFTPLFLEACGGVMQRNTFGGNTERGKGANSDNEDRWKRWGRKGGGGRGRMI